MDRPVVLNSLLCFIHNYRDSLLPDELRALVNNYFPKNAINLAHATLLELLPTAYVKGEPSSAASPSGLIHLYDRISKSDQSPVFAAADLNILPLTLISDEEDSKNELIREIRQLKRFIHDALNGKVEEPSSQVDSAVQTTDAEIVHERLKPEVECSVRNNNLRTNACRCSVELATSASSTIFCSSPCTSLLTTTTALPSPCSRPELCILNSNINSNNNCNNRNSNNVEKNTNNINNNHTKKKRDGCGHKLDAMVKKLADRQKEKEAMESPPHSGIWQNPVVDTLAYANLFRTMIPAVATTTSSSSSSIFPSHNNAATSSECGKVDSIMTEYGESMDETINDGTEKISNESSPSPSDSSNNIDEQAYSSADLAEKPFTCEHTNCHKRFANKFLLKKHQFIHTGLRPHCCPFCSKRFNRKDNLLRHKKTHLANALRNAHLLLSSNPVT